MNTFLILVSLLLNGVMIMAVIILFTRQNRFLQMEQKQEKMIHDMEDLISAYLLEMKEENEKFIERFNKNSLSVDEESRSMNQSIDHKEPVADNQVDPIQTINRNAAVKAYQQSNLIRNAEVSDKPDEKNQMVESNPPNMPPLPLKELSLKEQVLQLKEQGHTQEEIAKKLQKGKTEIELMLKFQEK